MDNKPTYQELIDRVAELEKKLAKTQWKGEIDSRKQAEQNLQIINERYKKAQQIGNVGNWEYNIQTKEFWGSEQAKRIYGFDPAAVSFTTEEVESCIPQRERVQQALIDLIEHNKPYNLEFDIITKDTQKRKTISSIAKLERDTKGNPVKVTGVIQDITIRKKTEKALKDSKNRYKRLVEGLPDIVYIYNCNKGATYWSGQVEKILGFSQNELNSDPLKWTNQIHKEDIEKVKTKLQNIKENDTFNIEYRIYDNNGKIHWFQDRAFNITNINGELIIEGIATDITDRKKAEKALKESEEKNRRIIKYMPVPIAITKGIDEEIVYLNSKFIETYGYSTDDLKTSNDWNLLAYPNPEYREKISIEWKKKIEEAIKNQSEIEPVSAYVQCKNGQRKHIKAYAFSVEDINIGAIIDITERKQAEQALKNSLIDLKLAQKIAKIGNWKFDPAIGIPEWSDHIYQIYERNPALGPPHIDQYKQMYKHQQYQTFINAFQNAVNNGLPYDIKLKLELKNNKVKWIHAICRPDKEKKQKGHFLRGTIQDITDQKLAEQKIQEYTNDLEEANATKDRFISVLGHDLRNPFNTILGFTDLLLRNIERYDKEKIKQFIANIHISTKQTCDLLNSLLEWSRSQRGKIPFNPVTIDVFNLTYEPYTHVIESAEAKKITIDFDVPVHIKAYADSNMIKTVIRNLLSNAVKFTPENGNITISAQQTVDSVKITITDTGIGMDEETKKSLFKIDETYSREGTHGEKGTGFGLLLCKEFIEKHGGKIWAESQEGKGTKFSFTIKNTGKQ